jgi:hypothetical protein
MFPATATHSSIDSRPPKPRAFVLPVVRPLPPRPAGSAQTW